MSVPLTRLDDAIDASLNDVLDLLCELIAIPSLPGQEAHVRQRLQDWADAAGLPWRPVSAPDGLMDDPWATQIPDHPGYADQYNLVMDAPSSRIGRSLVLNTHMDTVAGDMNPVRDGEWIAGRGACDAKGQIVTALLVPLVLHRLGVRLQGRLSVQCVFEEEAGGNGTLALLRQGEIADAAIVLEPTSLTMHPANRGAVWYRIEAEGRAAHMGKWWDGINAISEMSLVLNALNEFETHLRRVFAGHPLFPHHPSPVVVNYGCIRGGEWPASVADQCVLEGGVAFLPDWSCQQVVDQMDQWLTHALPESVRKRVRLSAGRLRNEPYATPLDAPVVGCFADASHGILPDLPLSGWIASCDARLFHHVAGMPVLTFGPGDLADAHSAQERIRIQDIRSAARVLIRMAVRWCGVEDMDT